MENYLDEIEMDESIKSMDKIIFKGISANRVASIQDYLIKGSTGFINNFNLIRYWLSIVDSPLKKFALDVIVIPGSNCSIERLFSYSSIIEDKKRLKLSSDRKSKLVCLQCWVKNDALESI